MKFAGRTTLVTGASTGIGAAYARSFAAAGSHLVLVARRRQPLEDLAEELRAAHGVEVEVVAMDLARPGAAAALHAETTARGLVVDVLVNNAGFATHGDVAEADPERLEEEVQLNCATLTGTTSRYLPGMVERGHGAVVNVASTAAHQPLPHMAVYGATKAYVLSFTQALWSETRGTGVQALAVCPGATDTPFFEVAGEDAAVGRKRTPEQVVRATLSALERDRPSVVDGTSNALLARVVTRLLPERAVIAVAERSMRASA